MESSVGGKRAKALKIGPFVVFFSQDGTRSRIYVMDLMAYRTGHRLIDVAILRSIFGRKALNS